MLNLLTTTLAQTNSEIFGEVEPPQGVAAYNEAVGGGIGLVLFLSRVIRLITIAGGIFVFVNIIYAGWLYLSSMGDTGKTKQAFDTIIYSVIGLAVIIGSYAIAGIVGLVFFGDATYILNPVICGPEGCD